MLPAYESLSDADLGDLARGGDISARNALALRYDRWGRSFAFRYRSLGVPEEDLEQASAIGLLEAAATFNGDKGRFTTHSVTYLHGQLHRVTGATAWPVALSDHGTRIQARVARARRDLPRKLGRAPTFEEVVKHTGDAAVAVRQVLAVVDAPQVYLNSDCYAGPGADRAMAELVPDPKNRTLEEIEAGELASAVRGALGTLDPRLQEVVRRYCSFDSDNEPTLADIAREMGFCRERARQLKDRAVKELREGHSETLREYHPAPVERKPPADGLDDETRSMLARERELYRQRQAAREGS